MHSMMQYQKLSTAGLFNANAPRYTSYPTANHFADAVGPEQYASWLRGLEPSSEVSLYVHIPFCERLCWYCACRTQGVNSKRPVAAYLDILSKEISRISSKLQDGVHVRNLHWGGGSPTILDPEMIDALSDELRSNFPRADTFEFSVEIDPTAIDAPRMKALSRADMTRASIGVQDFDPLVQKSIGRLQGFDVTRDCVEQLRALGITSVNFDLVYGLPHQNAERLGRTIDQVLTLRPDRIALYGYAHVPWMAVRQKMICEDDLPSPPERLQLFALAAKKLTEAGYRQIGIDHFVLPTDSMAKADAAETLRRNFQGYTDDPCDTLIGLGASAISQLPQGYAQNRAATSTYTKAIEDGGLATARGHSLTLLDRATARAIEALMCRFRLDLAPIAAEFGDASDILRARIEELSREFTDFVAWNGDLLEILDEGRALTRLIASRLDAYFVSGTRHSKAI